MSVGSPFGAFAPERRAADANGGGGRREVATAEVGRALRHLLDHLRTGRPICEADRQLLVEGIAAWLGARGEVPLDRALGLVPAPSRRSPHTIEALRLRDQLIRETAAAHFPGPSQKAKAEQIAVALARYAASGWRHERTKEACPHAPGTLRAALWGILTASPVPLSERRIRAILSTRDLSPGG